MARRYHSPSSIKLGARCQRAWAEVYIAGNREPNVPWAEIVAGKEVSSRVRAASLGVAVHAVLEGWQRGEAVDWDDAPGQVALSGAHLVPHPSRIRPRLAIPERSIGVVPNVGRTHDHEPATLLEIHGLMWGGFRDLLVSCPEEFRRLGIVAPDDWATYDYKSTSSIEQWALTAAKLARDEQAAIYTIDACETLGLDRMPLRWLYLETKAVRRAHPVDVTMTYADALEIMGPCAELARELDTLIRVEDASQNPDACSDYGRPGAANCPQHKANGGACCPPRRSIGAQLAQLRKKPKETQIMPLDPKLKAEFDARRNAAQPAAAPAAKPRPAKPVRPSSAAPAADEAEAAPPPAPAADEAEAAPPPAPKTRAPKRAAAPPVEAEAPQALTQAEHVASLAADLAAIDAQRDAVLADLRAAVA